MASWKAMTGRQQPTPIQAMKFRKSMGIPVRKKHWFSALRRIRLKLPTDEIFLPEDAKGRSGSLRRKP